MRQADRALRLWFGEFVLNVSIDYASRIACFGAQIECRNVYEMGILYPIRPPWIVSNLVRV